MKRMKLRCQFMFIRSSKFNYSVSRNASSKIYPSSMAALHDLKDGATMLFSGFGVCGIPENLTKAIKEKGTKNLTVVSNDLGTDDFGLDELLSAGQIDRVFASYVGENKKVPKLLNSGKIELNLIPQGTLAEKLRSGGAGIPAFYTPTGMGTVVQLGNFPVKYNPDGTVAKVSQPKETREFNGKQYVLEESITGDFACIKAWKADPAGNLIFHSTARNFNPDVAKAGRITIAEVEEIVELGELKPDQIHLPGIYIQRVVKGEVYEKRIEKLTTSDGPKVSRKHGHSHASSFNESEEDSEQHQVKRDRIAKRAAKEFKDGMYVNLGIGIPTIASNYIPEGVNVVLQSENGLLGVGPYPPYGKHDPDLINAGKETVSYLPGSAVFCSSDSFAMIRGGHVNLTILGTLEVSEKGDLASFFIPGKTIKGMGGAMDLVSACKRIVVTTTHVDKAGRPKILKNCNLPLTAKAKVDMIITDLAVFEVDRHGGTGMTLIEVAGGVTVEEIRSKTQADFKVADNLKSF